MMIVLVLLVGGTGLFARAKVLFSPSGTYAFPVAGDVKEMAWTHDHWNGGNAVDILAAQNLAPTSPAFRAFDRSPIVAVVSGTVKRADNEIGGTALLLFGDDGREYYYAHLSSTTVAGSMSVKAGEQIGVIGRSGRWARYLEIHLHFAVSSKWHTGLLWKNDVNAAEWFDKIFGLQWIDQTPVPYPAAMPRGSPLRPPYRIVTTFARMRSRNPDMASVRMAPAGGGPVPVYSTLLGEVRVLRATILGLRVQVTNRHTGQTVVYSGLGSTRLRPGDVVNHGQIVGETTSPIDYMYFNRGTLTDPTTTFHRAAGLAAAGDLLD
jgi:hypothetical protein